MNSVVNFDTPVGCRNILAMLKLGHSRLRVKSLLDGVTLNPYHTFLGLPESETAPDHYQLFGLARFTSDPKAIRAALLARNTQLKSWDNSNLYREANALLDEVIEAAATLEDAARKSAYDVQLRSEDRPATSAPGDSRSIDSLFLAMVGGIVALSLLVAIPLFMWVRKAPPVAQSEPVASLSSVQESKPEVVEVVLSEQPPNLDAMDKTEPLEPEPKTDPEPKPEPEPKSVPLEVPDWAQGNARELATLAGHTNFVWGLAFHPDGRRLASASTDKTVKIWDTTTGRATHAFIAHTAPVWKVAFSHDGKDLASASGDGTVMVWDATTGLKSQTFRGSGSVFDVAYSVNGMLASGSDAVRVWDVVTEKELLNLRGPRLFGSVVFAPKGDRLAATSDKSVKVWDTNGQELLTLTGHTKFVNQVVFSPDGKLLATASLDNSVKTWDSSSGQLLLTLKGHTAYLRSVAFSVDGKLLVSAHDPIAKDKLAELKFWDATTGEEKFTLRDHQEAINFVTFSQDGKLLASASNDKLIKIWGPVETTQPNTTLPDTPPDNLKPPSKPSSGQPDLVTLTGHESFVHQAVFSPDGTRVASASSDQTVKVWDAVSGQELLTLTGHSTIVSGVAFNGDGSRLASASTQTVKVWDAITGQQIHSTSGGGGFDRVAFSPDGTRFASVALDDGSFKVWSATTGKELLSQQLQAATISSIAVSPDLARVAIAGTGDKLQVLDVASGKQSVTFMTSSRSLTFSKDGKLLISRDIDRLVRVWDWSRGQELLTLDEAVDTASLSSDGKLLATAGAALSRSPEIKIWELPKSRRLKTRKLLTLTGHEGGIQSVAFSNDGHRLVSAGFDKTVKIWNLSTSQPKK